MPNMALRKMLPARGGQTIPRLGGIRVTMTTVQMVIDEPHRLHEGVPRRRTHEGPVPLLQVL